MRKRSPWSWPRTAIPRPSSRRSSINSLAGLEHRPELDVTVVPHLYDLAPDGPAVRLLRAIQGDMIVLAWLYPARPTGCSRRTASRADWAGRFPGREDERLEPRRRSPVAGTSPIGRSGASISARTTDAEPYLRQVAEIARPARGPAGDAQPLAAQPNGNAKVAGRNGPAAVVSGDRPGPLHRLQGVLELLPVRGLQPGRGRGDLRRAARRMPARLPGVCPDLPRGGDHVPAAQGPGDRRRPAGPAPG